MESSLRAIRLAIVAKEVQVTMIETFHVSWLLAYTTLNGILTRQLIWQGFSTHNDQRLHQMMMMIASLIASLACLMIEVS